MRVIPDTRPALRLVHGAGTAPVEWTWFCGQCAAPSPYGVAPPPTSRVCPSCGLGILLETRSDVVPSGRDAFLVVDTRLLVQAMSRRAQTLLGVPEEDAINRAVTELIVPADAEAGMQSSFATAITGCASGGDEPASAFVRPWNTFGVRMRARVAPCGPPRAALVVLEDAPVGRLRVVE